MSRRRQDARERGLCTRCCKAKPAEGRAVCAPCKAATMRWTQRNREKNRGTKSRYALVAHERAGDVALEHDFHIAAGQHYQDALGAATPVSDDHHRIAQKLIWALFLGGNSDTARALCDRLLASYLATPGNGAKAVDIMLQLPRHLFADSRTTEALPILAQAIELSDRLGERGRWVLANLEMHGYCMQLGRYNEAASFLDAVGDLGKDSSETVRIFYYKRRAEESVLRGEAVKTFRYFEKILPLVEESNNVYRTVAIWTDYALFALFLGDMDRAKSHSERALLIARQHHFIWYLPLLCLKYARILRFLGQASSAHGYLLEALSFDARTSRFDYALAEFGIPLALQMGDDVTLQKCANPAILTRTFQSGVIESIGPVAAAFAQLAHARGDSKEAERLLHQAVKAVVPGRDWELPLEIARHGAETDVPAARTLLECRTVLPNSAVARACLQLFDAYIAQRKGNHSAVNAHANSAVKGFEALRWHLYAEEARSLLPGFTQTVPVTGTHLLPFADLEAGLTLREQQVAGFALRGMSNRAIAAELSITENTVEKHMTAIMTRLGIRSRHQLASAIEGAPTLLDHR